jgi:predicted ribosomally synthesized peptide with SipW-like signal peptide
MRRILLSMMVIGAVAAMVSGASFSAFTDEESASGQVQAGTVQIDDGGVGTLVLSTGAGGCPDNMGSGDTCSIVNSPGLPGYAINWTGSLDAHIAISLDVVESVAGCFMVTGTAGSDATGQGGQFLLPVPPLGLDPLGFPVDGGVNETIPIQVIATLTGGNNCQGATADITVNAVATED